MDDKVIDKNLVHASNYSVVRSDMGEYYIEFRQTAPVFKGVDIVAHETVAVAGVYISDEGIKKLIKSIQGLEAPSSEG